MITIRIRFQALGVRQQLSKSTGNSSHKETGESVFQNIATSKDVLFAFFAVPRDMWLHSLPYYSYQFTSPVYGDHNLPSHLVELSSRRTLQFSSLNSILRGMGAIDLCALIGPERVTPTAWLDRHLFSPKNNPERSLPPLINVLHFTKFEALFGLFS